MTNCSPYGVRYTELDVLATCVDPASHID